MGVRCRGGSRRWRDRRPISPRASPKMSRSSSSSGCSVASSGLSSGLQCPWPPDDAPARLAGGSRHLLAGPAWTSLAAQTEDPIRLHVTLTQDSSVRGGPRPDRPLRKPARRREPLAWTPCGPDCRCACTTGWRCGARGTVGSTTFPARPEWDVVVRHEPLLDQYTLLTLVGARRQERRYATLDALGRGTRLCVPGQRSTGRGRWLLLCRLATGLHALGFRSR